MTTKAGLAALSRFCHPRGIIHEDGTIEPPAAEMVAAIEAEAREGYVPASLSPEWHAELTFSAVEAVAAERERIAERISALPIVRVGNASFDKVGILHFDMGVFDDPQETVDRAAVLALLDGPP
jgi:hypothetical protein